MHVYSQWQGPQTYHDISGLQQTSSPSSANLKSAATVAADLGNEGTGVGAANKMSTLRISQSVSEPPVQFVGFTLVSRRQ